MANESMEERGRPRASERGPNDSNWLPAAIEGDVEYLLQFDSRHHVVLITFGRVITKAAALAVHEAVERLVAAHGPCASITDLSITVKSDLSPQFVRSMAAVSPAIPAASRKILVAPTPETYGISRMFQALREGTGDTLQVVYTLDEAYRYLGIESPEFQTVESGWLGVRVAAY
jgi:hypothetical protein